MGNNIARLCGIRTSPPPRSRAEAELRLTDSYASLPAAAEATA
jgi:hypothetical protein